MSLNTRDLHKRKSIFTWIQKSDMFLQETYSTPEINGMEKLFLVMDQTIAEECLF